jgi:hypothetical protein
MAAGTSSGNPDVPIPFDACDPSGTFVFVSYAHDDRALVYPELVRIRSFGIRVWYDEGIEPGSEWPETIATALDRAAAFVVMITPTAVASRNVRNEINAALSWGKPVFAVYLAQTTLPKGLELQIGAVQAVMRWRMDEDSYARRLGKALADYAEAGNDASSAGPPVPAIPETFLQYLAALGLEPYHRQPPRIVLNPDIPGSFYDPETHRIVISPDLADNQHIVFREYCNYVLISDDLSVEFADAAYDLLSGLSFYFPCSFTGDSEGFSPFGISLDDTKQMIRRRGTPSPGNQPRAFIWASIFWQARQLMDPRVEDKLIADAWLETIAAAGKSSRPADKPHRLGYRAIEDQFIQRMYGLARAGLQPEQSQALAELLIRRRVLTAEPPMDAEALAIPGVGPVLLSSEPVKVPPPGKAGSDESHRNTTETIRPDSVAASHEPGRAPRSGVFISYAHKDDQSWLDSLLVNLSWLKDQHNVEIWTDRDIEPGDTWDEEIQAALGRAKVAVLLVSPQFLNSSYILNNELPKILQAAETDGMQIFWIPVRASSAKYSPIAKFQAAYPPDKPLAGLRRAVRDQAFVDIVDKLAKVLGVIET